ncbi:hypothetical protein ACA910_001570 [Epithemia clementina (nom. ined.)]
MNALGYPKLEPKSPVPSDIEISQDIVKNVGLLPLKDLAEQLGLSDDEVIPWGIAKAKIPLSAIERRRGGSAATTTPSTSAHYVVVTGINPTPLGEGKSTTTIGLAQALGAILGHTAVACIRQPSQGPTFGIKGGAAGGGYAQVVPMEEFNLHLTGDIHAVTAANNLLAAALESRLFHEASQTDTALFKRIVLAKGKDEFTPILKRRLVKLGWDANLKPSELTPEQVTQFIRLNIDPSTITWQRVLDTCDRHLRKVQVGLGPQETVKSPTDPNAPRVPHSRLTGFDITVASEVMAVLALARDLPDLRDKLGSMVVGYSFPDPTTGKRQAVTADDLGCGGALTVLMKDALMPTLMQTVERTPVLVHAGPFANIATGNSSVVADELALQLVSANQQAKGANATTSGFVVTEAGFGADIGMEKCFNIKCRASPDILQPRCAVIVATVRALKMHGGGPPVVAGRPLAPEYASEERLDLVTAGCANLARHIANARKFGVRVVVAINQFKTDTPAELQAVQEEAVKAGAHAAVIANHWALGGQGAADLARAVAEACDTAVREGDQFRFLYDGTLSIAEKIETISREIYGASGVEYSELAQRQMQQYQEAGYDQFPICIAKTQYSFSCNPTLKGVPTDHVVTVREIRACVGAGFLYPICGDIMTVPGLSTRPGFYDVDLNLETGEVLGLF